LAVAARRDWGYAFIFLAIVSALFVVLRFSGRAFLALEFEVLVIHLPTVVCLLVYAANRRFGFLSKPVA